MLFPAVPENFEVNSTTPLPNEVAVQLASLSLLISFTITVAITLGLCDELKVIFVTWVFGSHNEGYLKPTCVFDV